MSTLGNLLSLARAGYVLAREGVISALPSDPLPPPARFGQKLAGLIRRSRARNTTRSEKLSVALNRLGPSWVKLGQFLATRPDVVGSEIAGDLELLQDRMQPFPRAEAVRQIEASLGRPLDGMFSDFSEPVAAASVAQVHKAMRRRDGATVAVKVIRPGVRPRFRRDLETFYTLARLQEKHIPASRRLRPVAVTDTLAQSAKIEMDMRLEAAAFSELGENTKDDPGFRVPQVDWELSGRDCVTMEWVEGLKLSNVDGIRAAGHDLEQLAATLVQSFLRHTLRDGFFHADMHPGNLFVDAAGDIVAVDLGIAGRLGKKERRFLAEILYGFITRDYTRVAEVHFEAGYVPPGHSIDAFAQALRAVGEPLFGKSADKVDMSRVLQQLFDVTALFDMHLRPELVLLQRTMVTVEGVARSLDPEINMWDAAAPVVRSYIADAIGPREHARRLREAALKALELAPRLPSIVEQIANAAERAAAQPAVSEQKRGGRMLTLSLFVLAISALVLAAAIYWR